MFKNERNSILFRTAAVFALLLALVIVCIVRILLISSSQQLKTSASNNSYSINVKRLRGTVFDTNLRPITNRESEYIAFVFPTEQAIIKISEVLKGEQLESVLNTLKDGKVAVVELENDLQAEGIECIKVKKHITENTAAEHLIGYLDATGHGVCGLEADFDDILYSEKYINLRYSCDAKGNLLYDDIEIDFDESVYNNCVVTTIDLSMQEIVEKAMQSVTKGAAVVIEAGTGKLRAMVSKPSYNQTKIKDYLSDTDAALINRALSAYDVGSVFKPCIAAAALDSDVNLAGDYFCSGSQVIANHNFVCNSHSGHGNLNLQSAIAYSCNTYFYNLAVNTGATSLYGAASNYPFGQVIYLTKSIKTAKGNLTSLSRLKTSDAAIANFAIGQGDLLISPLALATLYDAIACSGVYKTPSLIEKTIVDGDVNEYETTASTRVMSEKTANTIKEYLKSVVLYGTGTKANPSLVSAAGKTATAQTGSVIGQNKISNGWFCGFFPADEPKYVVVIVAEGAKSGGEIAAPIFSSIADESVRYGLVN